MNIRQIKSKVDYDHAIRRMSDIEYELAYEYRADLSIELDLLTSSTFEYERKPKIGRFDVQFNSLTDI
jgi:hypothetical protein